MWNVQRIDDVIVKKVENNFYCQKWAANLVCKILSHRGFMWKLVVLEVCQKSLWKIYCTFCGAKLPKMNYNLVNDSSLFLPDIIFPVISAFYLCLPFLVILSKHVTTIHDMKMMIANKTKTLLRSFKINTNVRFSVNLQMKFKIH